MRRWVVGICAVLAAVVDASSARGAGKPPLVHVATRVVTKTWEPIALPEVRKVLESAALDLLSAPGKMRLRRVALAEVSKGDYALLIQGRFIEEAERFSVYLTFRPGSRGDLPSFHAADTSSPLGHKRRSTMERLIRQTTRRAASRLIEVLAPQLESARLGTPLPVLERPALPQAWGVIDVPRVRNRSKTMGLLLDARQPDHVRLGALRDVQGHAFEQRAVRDALLLCVLRDPSPKVRTGCTRALEPVARAHVPTQRVLLAAMRREVDDGVLRALTAISGMFVGLSRAETLATWLELVASDATPARSAEHIARLLAQEDNLPNLEIAVAACLQQEALAPGKKLACAKSLLREVPQQRRFAVVAPYLRRVAVYGTWERLTLDAVTRALFARVKGGQSAEPALSRMLLALAERSSAGRARGKAVGLAARYADPTRETLQRLVQLADDVVLGPSIPRAVVAVVRRNRALAAEAKRALQRVRRNVRFLRPPNVPDPYQALDRAIDRLSQM